jgi:hypothetical protein
MSVEVAFVVVATIVWLALAAVAVLVVVAAGEGDAVADVEHYLELTRAYEARHALWSSCDRAQPTTDTKGRTRCVFSSPGQAAQSAAASFPS